MADKGLTYAGAVLRQAAERVLSLGTIAAARGDSPRVAFSGCLDLAG